MLKILVGYKKAKIAESVTSLDVVKDTDTDSDFFRSLESSGILLNERQVQAVRHKDGPALVLSCAGSGKTSVLTARCSYLISQLGVDPQRIMLVTFTRKAADEMVERLGKLTSMNSRVANKITAGTFHSIFLKVLRENGNEKEIWSSTKSKEITIKTILRKFGIEKMYEPEVILSQISSYKNRLIGVEDAPQEDRHQREFVLIWKEYEQHKKNDNLIDFDDMLIETYKLFKSSPEVLEKVRSKYDYILIDEFQDTNYAQFELTKLIVYPRNNLFVVGDDWQVIFSFAGARSENILNFKKFYPGTQIIPLEINYRSTDYIVGLGNAVISENANQMKKNVFSVKTSELKPNFILPDTAESEAECIVDEIEELVSNNRAKYKDIAILYRNNSNSRAIYDELLIRKIPFTIFGEEELFYETPIVKPIIAYLKLAINPKDTKSIGQILPTLYIGRDKLKYISGQQLRNPIEYPIEHLLSTEMKSFQVSKVREKINMIKRLSDYHPVVAIKMVREDYEKYLIGEDEDSNTLHREIIRETLDELEASSLRFKTIEEYINFINMVIKNSKIQKEMQKNKSNDSIKLMTIHRSKGLEFERVYLIHSSEGVLPHSSSLEKCDDVIPDDENYDPLEEERRLAYVAITRAREFLTISAPQMYRGRNVRPSRFIEKYIEQDKR